MPRDLPKFLTSPGHAIAHRKRWENRVTEEMRFVVDDTPYDDWGIVSQQLVRRIPWLSVWARELVLTAFPTAEEDPDQTVERLARTISTATYNIQVLQRLSNEGFTQKMWLTRHDPLVRPTHREADGQTVPLSRPFTVGGQFLQYPAHSATASIDLWIGCRCMVLGRP